MLFPILLLFLDQDIDGGAVERELSPSAILIFTVASVVVGSAQIGMNLMGLPNSGGALTSLKVDITSENFDLSITGGAVNHDETIGLSGKAYGVVDGEIEECWDYDLDLIIEEPVWNPDCIHYSGTIKHICAPHDGDNGQGNALSINERLCTDSSDDLNTKEQGGDQWKKVDIDKECEDHNSVGHEDCITDGSLEILVDFDWHNEVVAHNFDYGLILYCDNNIELNYIIKATFIILFLLQINP